MVFGMRLGNGFGTFRGRFWGPFVTPKWLSLKLLGEMFRNIKMSTAPRRELNFHSSKGPKNTIFRVKVGLRFAKVLRQRFKIDFRTILAPS